MRATPVLVVAVLITACGDGGPDPVARPAPAPAITAAASTQAATTPPPTAAPPPTLTSPTTGPARGVDTTTAATSEPPPPEFEAVVDHVPPDVVARATWQEGCPVALEHLRYVRLSHWGFDGAVHTGELIVHADVVSDIVVVFAQLLEAGFPIEEMRVETPADVQSPSPDYNNTTAFTCRPVTGTSSTWSQHAYGLAIDINPLNNPYLREDVLLPELAGDYLDRDDVRPGMIVEGDAVVQAFDAIGWGWGGRWRSLKDWQHFSFTGR